MPEEGPEAGAWTCLNVTDMTEDAVRNGPRHIWKSAGPVKIPYSFFKQSIYRYLSYDGKGHVKMHPQDTGRHELRFPIRSAPVRAGLRSKVAPEGPSCSDLTMPIPQAIAHWSIRGTTVRFGSFFQKLFSDPTLLPSRHTFHVFGWGYLKSLGETAGEGLSKYALRLG